MVLDDGCSLVLTLNIGDVWKPVFVFSLVPVGLDKIDVVEAKLRDAQEEIEALKFEVATLKADVNPLKVAVFLSLSSRDNTHNQAYVKWNGTDIKTNPDYFKISVNQDVVTILKSGVYQVHARLGQTNSANTCFLSLELNSSSFAKCLQSDATGHQNTAQLTELMRLNVNDRLAVKCGANGNSIANTEMTRFSILLLGS